MPVTPPHRLNIIGGGISMTDLGSRPLAELFLYLLNANFELPGYFRLGRS